MAGRSPEGQEITETLALASLRRRVRAMHSLFEEAVATMTVDQVNYVERDPVLPIAFSLFHQAHLEDTAVVLLGGPGPIWNETWAARMELGVLDHGKHRTVAEMMGQRIGGYEAFRAYQAAVFSTTESWLDDIDGSDLERVVVTRPLPPEIASTFSARVATERGLTLLDGIECWIYQHGLRHMGEIEHARALVGLGGLTS